MGSAALWGHFPGCSLNGSFILIKSVLGKPRGISQESVSKLGKAGFKLRDKDIINLTGAERPEPAFGGEAGGGESRSDQNDNDVQ